MAVPRDYTPDNFLGGTAPVQGSAQAPQVAGGGEGGGNALLQGSVSRTSGTFGRSATVKAGEDIRPALNSLKSAGGGTLILLAGVHRIDYDLEGGDKINMIGEGANLTILDFQSGGYSLKYVGVESSIVTNFKIEGLTIKNAGVVSTTAGVIIDYCDNWSMTNVLVVDALDNGVVIRYSQQFVIQSCVFESCGSDGIRLDGGGDLLKRAVDDFTFIGCKALDNVNDGFQTQLTPIENGTYIGCRAVNNGQNGFFIYRGEGIGLVGCASLDNTLHGFTLQAGAVQAVSCLAKTNGGNGFFVDPGAASLVGCIASSNTDHNYQMITAGSGARIVLSGNIFARTSSASETDGAEMLDTNTNSIGNAAAGSMMKQEIEQAWNNSGGTLAPGTVVVRKAHSSGYQISTTTTQGDDKVFGVIIYSIVDNSITPVLTIGKTTLLKVNGVTDIAIGDFLCTYTVAGISAKAGSGDMAFAIALEAYTTDDSAGVIDALLISPRKI